MEFGVFIAGHWLDRSKPAKQLFDEMLDEAVLADRLGYDMVWLAEHYIIDYITLPDPLGFAAAIFERMTFDTEATDTLTTAAEAFREKHGVCQDFAHLFIACARSLGLPARYVSGYFVHQNGQTEHEAGHAWAELLVPDLGWVGFDPANAVCAGENYVRVACGLDYLGAAPVRGIQSGGNDEALKVAVKVSQTDHMADRMADNQ